MIKKIKQKFYQRFIKEYDQLAKIKPLDQEEEEELKKEIKRIIEEISQQDHLFLTLNDKEALTTELVDEIIGLGPLKKLLEDKSITEIMVNGPKKIYIEREGKMQLTELKFEDEAHLMRTIHRILEPTRRRVDESCPFTDISLPDGSRVNIIIPPLSLTGPSITIRKFFKEIKDVQDLVSLGTINEKMSKFLVDAIKARLNIIFSGATGSGKTTTLNILSSYIEPSERIVVIEDTAELSLSQDHVVKLQTKPPSIEGKGEITIRDLFRNSLRMRPRRIILGEIRGSEALDMLQAMSSGHKGSLAVLHAASPQDAIYRIETMVLLSGVNIPIWAIRGQIASSLDLIIQQDQLFDGSRKITHITEVRGIQNDEIILQDLFSFEMKGIDSEGKEISEWKGWGIIPLFYSQFSKRGIELPEDVFK